MKICIFSANYLPNIGGIERYTYHISKELIAMGYSVTVVTSNVFGLETHEVQDEIEIYRLPCINLLNGRYPVYKNNKEFKVINKELVKHDFDFVVVNARFYFHSLYGVKFAAKNNIPCITIEHGSSHLSVNNALLDYFGGIYEHAFTHFVKKYCKDFYGVSKAACEWSGHFGIRSKGVLYNAVDIESIQRIIDAPVSSYRKEFNIPENDKIVVYTGRLVEEKGSYELAKAVDELPCENVWLFIAGDGDMREKIDLISQKNNRVIALGGIDFAHVVSLLKEADIFCLPTVYPEGLPTSVLEAVAARCFIITTNYGGAKELISDDSYGILIDDKAANKVKAALEKALSDDEYRAQATDKSYERLISEFTWKNTAKELEKIIKSKI